VQLIIYQPEDSEPKATTLLANTKTTTQRVTCCYFNNQANDEKSAILLITFSFSGIKSSLLRLWQLRAIERCGMIALVLSLHVLTLSCSQSNLISIAIFHTCKDLSPFSY
jgi:hypothetical protein